MRLRAITLTGAGIALALVGCSDQKNENQKTSPWPAGYELAKAKSSRAQGKSQIIEINADELAALKAQRAVRLIDVRRDDEVAQGMIPGAEHIPLDTFDPASLDLSDRREVVLYCRSGRRSAIAAQRLADRIGRPAKHLQGGYLAWVARQGD